MVQLLIMRNKTKRFRLTPGMNIILGFLGLILFGTFLLCLPISNTSHKWLNFVDSLFTSTSAVCVTGLTVVDTATNFTYFGKTVILFLIQIGGLGIVALSSLIFLIIRKKINLYDRLTIKESLNQDTMQGVVKFIIKTIWVTLLIEFIGALLLLYSTIAFTHSFWKGLYFAIFMSVSAFCNAGMDILGSNGSEFTSLYSFAGNITMLLPIMMLIVIGGIGFIVLFDGFKNFKSKQHTKVVLFMTFILIFGGAIAYTCLEWNNPNTLGNMSVGEKILNGFFQSITTRTAGFATLDQNLLTKGSRVLTIFLMYIGGAPNSTAGGIKVTTLFILFLFLFKLPNESGDIRLKDRKVSKKIIMKVFRLVCYSVLAIILGVILISLFEPESISLESIIFECVSALSTVGLSMGITPILNLGSKLVLIMLMFIGRVGLLTIALAFSSRSVNSKQPEIEFSNTDIII